MITVGVALALGIVGFIVSWPVDQAVPYLDPLARILAQFGLTLNQQLGFLALFACPSLLVVGSLLPGI